MENRESTWNRAAGDGLMLAFVTIIVTLISSFIKNFPGMGILFWLIKTAGSIWLLYYFIKAVAKDRKEAFRFGVKVSFCSSIIIAAFALVNILWLNPIDSQELYSLYSQSMGSSFGREQFQILEKIIFYLPAILPLWQIIWATLWGVVTSKIIASSIKFEEFI